MMEWITFPAITLAATLGLFTVYAIQGGGRVASLPSFFHLRGGGRNLVAIIVVNVTLGTGLAYLLTGGATNGLVMLAVPAGVVVGYWLLAAFLGRVTEVPGISGGNLLFALRARIEGERARSGITSRSLFDLAITLPLIIVFLLVFAFETFVSSQIIAPVIWPGVGLGGSMAVAAAIFGAALFYSMVGGMQAIFRSDVLQLFGILALLVLIAYGGFRSAGADAVQVAALIRIDSQVVVNAGTAFIAAIATQFYSLLNFYIASNLDQSVAQRRLMQRTGVIVAAMLAVIVVTGAVAGDALASGFGPFLSGVATNVSAIHVTGPIFLALLVFGMTAVVISTVDTLVISLTYFIHRNVMRRPEGDEADAHHRLRSVRILMLGLFLGAFVLLALLFALSPNIFYLLLSIASGPIVFAPLVAAAGLLMRREGGLKAVTNGWLMVFLLLFLSASLSSFAVLAIAPETIPYLSTIHAGVAAVLAVLIYFRGCRAGPDMSGD